jgi:protein Mpv17
MTVADLSQQRLERASQSPLQAIDWWRTARLVGFYSLLQMPFVHCWFGLLERVFGAVGPRSNLPRFVAKVAVDQACGLPSVLAAFCFVQPVLQGYGVAGGLQKLQHDWKVMVLAGWKVWFPTNLVVFAVVPLAFRPLSMNVVSLGWSMYVSSMGGSSASPEPSTRAAGRGAPSTQR